MAACLLFRLVLATRAAYTAAHFPVVGALTVPGVHVVLQRPVLGTRSSLQRALPGNAQFPVVCAQTVPGEHAVARGGQSWEPAVPRMHAVCTPRAWGPGLPCGAPAVRSSRIRLRALQAPFKGASPGASRRARGRRRRLPASSHQLLFFFLGAEV